MMNTSYSDADRDAFRDQNLVGFTLVTFDTTTIINTSFGGDGYTLMTGDIYGWGTLNGRGGGEVVSDCQVCADICTADSDCGSYECIPSTL